MVVPSFTVECPCCKAKLTLDPELQAVIAHEANNPLAAARAGLQLAAETVGRLAGLDPTARHDLLVELGEVEEAVDRTIDFLRAVADRARGSRSGPERFDVVGAVRSAVALESMRARCAQAVLCRRTASIGWA